MAGGAYIRIKDGNIEIHAPGKVELKGVSHDFGGPTSLSKSLPVLPNVKAKQQEYFILIDDLTKNIVTNQDYEITLDDGRVISGRTNEKGETQIASSNSWQIATVTALDNLDHEHVVAHKKKMILNEQPIEYAIEGVGKNNFKSDSFNWGMRRYNSGAKKYTVAEYYAQEMLKKFKDKSVFDWDNLSQTNNSRKLVEDLVTVAYQVIFSTKIEGSFALPKAVW